MHKDKDTWVADLVIVATDANGQDRSTPYLCEFIHHPDHTDEARQAALTKAAATWSDLSCPITVQVSPGPRHGKRRTIIEVAD